MPSSVAPPSPSEITSAVDRRRRVTTPEPERRLRQSATAFTAVPFSDQTAVAVALQRRCHPSLFPPSRRPLPQLASAASATRAPSCLPLPDAASRAAVPSNREPLPLRLTPPSRLSNAAASPLFRRVAAVSLCFFCLKNEPLPVCFRKIQNSTGTRFCTIRDTHEGSVNVSLSGPGVNRMSAQ